MSVISRKEQDPNERQYKYQFTLQIIKFTCDAPLNCIVKIMWKRNNRSIQTKTSYDVKMGVNEVNVKEQKLSNSSTFIYNLIDKKFMEKESQLVVNMYFNGSPKKLASCLIDSRCVLDPQNVRNCKSKQIEVDLTPCFKANNQVYDKSKIKYRLTGIFKQEVGDNQRFSATGPLNTSGYSIQQNYQRKYEIPSKDNMSVASYNPSSRYASNNKRDRDDSSQRRNDYGFGGLKSNISNQFTNNNDFDTRSGMKSMDNQANLNRILTQEQNKRSKVEAELSKNKVQIGQLKKRISQLAIQNLNLKQQVKKISDNKDTSSKQELNNLQYKLYQASKEARDAQNQIQLRKNESQRLQSQLMHIKIQQKSYQNEITSYRIKLQQLQRNTLNNKIVESIQNENNDLKYQIQNLRRFIEELKRQSNDKENQLRSQNYREIQEERSKVQYFQQQNQKLRCNFDISQELQRKISEHEHNLQILRQELSQKDRNILNINKELEEYKSRLLQYQNQKSIIQTQLIKLRQNQNDQKEIQRVKGEYNRKIQLLSSENQRINEQSKYYQKQYQDNQGIIQRMKIEYSQSENKMKSFLPQINQLQKKLKELEINNDHLSNQNQNLNRQKDNLKKEIVQKSQKYMTESTTSNPELDRLLRESLQMQVDLKFANDQLQRLRQIQEKYENQQWKAQKEERQRIQLEKQYQAIEKELAKKNRAFVIESEKTKVLQEEINQHSINRNAYQEEIQKLNFVVQKLEEEGRQVNTTNCHLGQENGRLQQQCSQLRNELDRISANLQQINILQERCRQLQVINQQKTEALEHTKNTLSITSQSLRQQKEVSQQLHGELSQKDRNLSILSSKLSQIQKTSSQTTQEYQKIISQKKMLEKRNGVLMEQMHKMKKNYQEQKGRSLSFTRGEEYNKVKTYQNEIEKKEKVISKLNKQKLQLQEENVKINVQVMKLLSELEKIKSGTGFNPTSSFKTINSMK